MCISIHVPFVIQIQQYFHVKMHSTQRSDVIYDVFVVDLKYNNIRTIITGIFFG